MLGLLFAALVFVDITDVNICYLKRKVVYLFFELIIFYPGNISTILGNSDVSTGSGR